MVRAPRLVVSCVAVLAACAGTTDTGPNPAADRPALTALPAFAPPPVGFDATVDDYHGTAIADPYRWLEDQDGERTAAFVAAQNAASRAFLDALPERESLRARLTELWEFARGGSPRRFGSHWFWTWQEGLQNQPVWRTAGTPDAAGDLLLDPNQLASDGTVALSGFVPSDDGDLVAFATSANGSDWQEWHVLDTATRQPLADHLRWSKFSTAAWTKDGRGFFYQRYPEPAAGEVYQATNRNPALCYHVLGTEQAADRIVYERPDQPDWGFEAKVTDDGRFLILDVTAGTDRRNGLFCADLEVEGWPVVPLQFAFDASYEFLGNDGDAFWLRTNRDAPLGRIVAMERTRPQELTTLVAEGRDALATAQVVAGRFLCSYVSDACHRLAVHGLDGQHQRDLPLPDLGSVGDVSGRPGDAVAYCTFESFTQPPVVLRLDPVGGAVRELRPSTFAGTTADLVTERRFLQSHDGARLCLFLVHQRDLVLDGSHPTYLYGYGGFDISLLPSFSVPNLVWVERGGIYAHAILRGGGEYGEAWHQAGMRGNKQKVFDDFVACADYLVRNGYTRRDKLGCGGRSNGGLLAGAMVTQQPDRFGAVIPEVGVLDMLRYHRFTIGWAWAPEYGTSDDPEQFAWLKSYSPLHAIVQGRHYPPTLVMTGDHDDRVLPGHSYKFAATLQAAQGGPAPILLRVDTAAGHGSGKPTRKKIDEAADRWAFLRAALGA